MNTSLEIKKQYIQDLEQCLNAILHVLPSFKAKKHTLKKEIKQLAKALKNNQKINHCKEYQSRINTRQKELSKELNKLIHQQELVLKQKQFLTAEIHAWKRTSVFASPKTFKMEDYPLIWNYRLLAHQKTNGIQFRIHEVQYLNGEPYGYMEGKGFHSWEKEEGFKVIEETMNNMKNAIFKPVLWAGEKFPQEYKE